MKPVRAPAFFISFTLIVIGAVLLTLSSVFVKAQNISARSLSVEISSNFTETHRSDEVPLVYGSTARYSAGILLFSTYNSSWQNTSTGVIVVTPLESKMYIFFTAKDNSKIERRSKSIYFGEVPDNAVPTFGYGQDWLSKDFLVRIMIPCESCSFERNLFLSEGSTTLVLRNEGRAYNSTLISIKIR